MSIAKQHAFTLTGGLGRLLAPALLLATLAGPSLAQTAGKNELVFASPILRQHFDPTTMIATISNGFTGPCLPWPVAGFAAPQSGSPSGSRHR